MTRYTCSAREAAQALGLGRSTTYELLRSGELPSIRVGRRVLIPLAALEGFIAKRLDLR